MQNKNETMFSQFTINSTFYRFVKIDKFYRWSYGKLRVMGLTFPFCTFFTLVEIVEPKVSCNLESKV